MTRSTHSEYMEHFGNTFYDSVKILADKNASQPNYLDKFALKDKQLLQEVLNHANFCNNCVDQFYGRADLIDQVT